MNEWMNEWMNGWMDGRMDGWTDGRTDGRTLFKCQSICSMYYPIVDTKEHSKYKIKKLID